MSERFKFRVWNNKDSWYFEDCPLELNYDGAFKKPEGFFQEWVVEQYTGLKDKNGKEIYEGDILFFEKEGFHSVKAEVKFGEHLVHSDDPFCAGKGWGFYVEYKDYTKRLTTDSLSNALGGLEANAFQKIGNIHENPEFRSSLYDMFY